MSAIVREFFVALSRAEVIALAEWHDARAGSVASEVRAERLRALVKPIPGRGPLPPKTSP